MSASRKRKRAVPEESHADSERWLVSYADMLTVLVGLFIVLYAISQVDQHKFEQLAASLAVGFGGSSQAVLHTGTSILADNSAIVPQISPNLQTPMDGSLATAIPVSQIAEKDPDAADPVDLEMAREEYSNLVELTEKLEATLAAKGLEGSVQYKINERGLVVGLVSDELFFVADTAKLTETSQRVVDTLGPTLGGLPNQILIEGHANTLPSRRYPTNWELSADRSTQVLRRFVEYGHVPSKRIASVGFGDSRPLISNDTDQGLTANRRVDIVILSTQPERIRELIPLVQEMMTSAAKEK